MKNKFLFLVLILLFNSCDEKVNIDHATSSLYNIPEVYPLNLKNGYVINPFTLDSIQPIINSFGKKIITGKKILLKSNPNKQNTLPEPKEISYKQFTPIVEFPKIIKFSRSHKKTLVDSNLINKVFLNKIDKDRKSSFVVNSVGRKILTGKPVLIKGVSQRVIQPKPIKAQLMRMNQDAKYNFQYLDVDEGLSSSYIYSMFEDKLGNIWFGTNGGGVTRYDGNSFFNFNKSNGISDISILSILQDKNGFFWFGTRENGIVKYDGKNITLYNVEVGLTNNSINCILEDISGNLWFGTNGGGASKFDGKHFTHFTTNEGICNDTILSMETDRKGNIWLGSNGGGVSKFNGNCFITFNKKNGLGHDVIRSIKEDHKGNLWFGTEGGGVKKYDGEYFTQFDEIDKLKTGVINCILCDSNGDLFLGASDGDLLKICTDGVFHFKAMDGLNPYEISSLLEDKSGNIWIGNYGSGVTKFDYNSFKHYSKKDGLGHSSIYGITEDKVGNIWFSTFGGGIAKYDSVSFTQFVFNDLNFENRILSILEDKKGNLWLGTHGGGVVKFDGKKAILYTIKDGLGSNVVWDILEDRSGNMWFATEGGGVTMFDGKYFNVIDEKDGLGRNTVWRIIEDRKGSLWFATRGGGLSNYNGKVLINYTEKEGLISNFISSLFEDKNGVLWIGTRGNGILKFDGKKFTSYDVEEGISNGMIWSIAEDKLNRLWFSTEKGITLFIPKSRGNKYKKGKNQEPEYLVQKFEKADGLKGLDLYLNSVEIDRMNRAWWGTGKGLTMLDLNTFETSRNITAPVLTQIDLNNNFIDFRNIDKKAVLNITYNNVAPFQNYPLDLELPYDCNHLTFNFVSIDWAAPHKIRYQFKLDGLDVEWNDVTDKTFADYRNIPYGNFTFKVRAIGESQIWSTSFEYSFVIHPPWWHTWWARTGYGLFALVMILALVRWRTAALRERQKQLEITVEERTAQIVAEKKIVEQQKHVIEEKQKEIIDSINYAKRIQQAQLPTQKYLDKYLNKKH